ncbi:MAG: hypothetical protein H6576_13200 [Lewinellaceae bacterium]|nr:hypothetical protein [Saprospiraceae bacterium]MCB9344653.1 hypothetical protein [Lewinellaceae bacterium]
MKRITAIFMLLYITIGKLFLPMGDFSVLPDLPAMYVHCKESEHHDMNPIDFITDHLINVDGFFDEHGHDDDQKPHHPYPLHHLPTQTLLFALNIVEISFTKTELFEKYIQPGYNNEFYVSNYLDSIFKPPRLA